MHLFFSVLSLQYFLTLNIVELTEGIWKVILSLLSSEILWTPSETCKCEDWI